MTCYGLFHFSQISIRYGNKTQNDVEWKCKKYTTSDKQEYIYIYIYIYIFKIKNKLIILT